MNRLTLLLLITLALSSCSKGSSPTKPPGGGSGNHSPAVSVNSSTTHLSYSGTATITVTASDVDGDQLSFSYTATGGTVSASGPTATTATFTAGTHWGPCSVTVTVSDGKGGSTPATATMYVRNPDPPQFVLEPVSTGACGPGTVNPTGFELQITSPEAITVTDIAMLPQTFCTPACGMSRHYRTPIAFSAGQAYLWSDGGCWLQSCCQSYGCSDCRPWAITISGNRPEPDGGSFYYTCTQWNDQFPTSGCQ